MTTPNIFATYTTHADDLSGGPAPKWQPVDATTVRLETGEVLMLERQAAMFEIGGDMKLKAITHCAYHAPTNTIYYYAPGPVFEAPADWIDPADWQLAHPKAGK